MPTIAEFAERFMDEYLPRQKPTERKSKRLTVPSHGGSGVLVDVIRELDAAGIRIDDVAQHRPTLDDVFLALTGHAAETDRTDRPADARRMPRTA